MEMKLNALQFTAEENIGERALTMKELAVLSSPLYGANAISLPDLEKEEKGKVEVNVKGQEVGVSNIFTEMTDEQIARYAEATALKAQLQGTIDMREALNDVFKDFYEKDLAHFSYLKETQFATEGLIPKIQELRGVSLEELERAVLIAGISLVAYGNKITDQKEFLETLGQVRAFAFNTEAKKQFGAMAHYIGAAYRIARDRFPGRFQKLDLRPSVSQRFAEKFRAEKAAKAAREAAREAGGERPAAAGGGR